VATSGWVAPEYLLSDLQGSLKEGFGLRVAAARLMHYSQIVQRARDVGVEWAPDPLANLERALVERLCLRIPPLLHVESCQRIEDRGHARILGRELLGLLDSGNELPFGFHVVALLGCRHPAVDVIIPRSFLGVRARRSGEQAEKSDQRRSAYAGSHKAGI
jgi:hypothetical protein